MVKYSIMDKKWLKELIDWVLVVVVAFAIAWSLNNFIITNSFIPTGSMERNLPVGSRVFGFRLQYLFSKPKRGDVVIFDYGYICKNKDCGKMYQKNEKGECPICGSISKKNKKAHYIKRVIGLPGDHIEIKTDYKVESELFRDIKFDSSMEVPCGHVYVNGEAQEEIYINEPMIVNGNFYPEIDVTVPEGCYFLLGDNRNNSEDARYWDNKFIPFEDIEAKAWILYWPLNRLSIVR